MNEDKKNANIMTECKSDNMEVYVYVDHTSVNVFILEWYCMTKVYTVNLDAWMCVYESTAKFKTQVKGCMETTAYIKTLLSPDFGLELEVNIRYIYEYKYMSININKYTVCWVYTKVHKKTFSKLTGL